MKLAVGSEVEESIGGVAEGSFMVDNGESARHSERGCKRLKKHRYAESFPWRMGLIIAPY